MRIDIYDADSGELIAADIDLHECFDGENEEYAEALESLDVVGEYFCGGGAAPAWHMAPTGPHA